MQVLLNIVNENQLEFAFKYFCDSFFKKSTSKNIS